MNSAFSGSIAVVLFMGISLCTTPVNPAFAAASEETNKPAVSEIEARDQYAAFLQEKLTFAYALEQELVKAGFVDTSETEKSYYHSRAGYRSTITELLWKLREDTTLTGKIRQIALDTKVPVDDRLNSLRKFNDGIDNFSRGTPFIEKSQRDGMYGIPEGGEGFAYLLEAEKIYGERLAFALSLARLFELDPFEGYYIRWPIDSDGMELLWERKPSEQDLQNIKKAFKNEDDSPYMDAKQRIRMILDDPDGYFDAVANQRLAETFARMEMRLGGQVPVRLILPEALPLLEKTPLQEFAYSDDLSENERKRPLNFAEGVRGNGLTLRRAEFPAVSKDLSYFAGWASHDYLDDEEKAAGNAQIKEYLKGEAGAGKVLALREGEHAYGLRLHDYHSRANSPAFLSLWKNTPIHRLQSVAPNLLPWREDTGLYWVESFSSERWRPLQLILVSTAPVEDVTAHMAGLTVFSLPPVYEPDKHEIDTQGNPVAQYVDAHGNVVAQTVPPSGTVEPVLSLVRNNNHMLFWMCLQGDSATIDRIFGPVSAIWIYWPDVDTAGNPWVEIRKAGAPSGVRSLEAGPILSLPEEAAKQSWADIHLANSLLRSLSEVKDIIPRFSEYAGREIPVPDNDTLRKALERCEDLCNELGIMDAKIRESVFYSYCLVGITEENFNAIRGILVDGKTEDMQDRVDSLVDWVYKYLEVER